MTTRPLLLRGTNSLTRRRVMFSWPARHRDTSQASCTNTLVSFSKIQREAASCVMAQSTSSARLSVQLARGREAFASRRLKGERGEGCVHWTYGQREAPHERPLSLSGLLETSGRAGVWPDSVQALGGTLSSGLPTSFVGVALQRFAARRGPLTGQSTAVSSRRTVAFSRSCSTQ